MAEPTWVLTGNREVSTELLLARKKDGTFAIASDVDILHVGTIPSALAVARGLVAGSQIASSYGELITAGAVTSHLVWPVAGAPDLAVPPIPGVNPEIVSTSADDSASGTGIRSVHVHYLDGDLSQVEETVALNGLTPVSMAATDVRFVQCMHIGEFGSQKVAAGNISLRAGGVTYSYISAGARRCTSSARRVPAGKRLIINSVYGGVTSGTAAARAQLRMFVTAIETHDYTEDGIMIPQMAIGLQDSSETLSGLHFPVPEGAVVGFEVTADKALTVSAGFVGYVEDL